MSKSKYSVYGPARDGEFICWQVVGPKGGLKGIFYTKKAARSFAQKLRRK
jgi:hypothetical protein